MCNQSNTKLDLLLVNFYKKIGEQKEMVTNSKPDFNNIEKAS